MTFYRRPALVEAEQWKGEEDHPLIQFLLWKNSWCLGLEEVKKGDWIITDREGHSYVCHAIDFDSIYEKVEEIEDEDSN